MLKGFCIAVDFIHMGIKGMKCERTIEDARSIYNTPKSRSSQKAKNIWLFF